MSTFTFGTAFFVEEWPLKASTLMHRGRVGEIRFSIFGLADGSFGISVLRDGIMENYTTDIVIPEADFRASLILSYAPTKLRATLSGIDLRASASEKTKDSVILTASGAVPVVVKLNFKNFVPDHASKADALFIRTACEIADSSRSNDWYEILN